EAARPGEEGRSHDSFPAEAGDPCVVVTDRPKDLIGLLAQGGRRPVDARRGPRQPDREARLADGSESRLIELDHHLTRDRLLVRERLLEVEHRLEAAVVLGGELCPLIPRTPAKDRRDLLSGVRAWVLELLLLELGTADPVAPVVPELRLEGSQRHP